MNNELVIKGYVLRNTEYGENDGILSVLTENGIISFKARGILKLNSKNRSSCLLYAFSEFVLEEKNNYLFLTKGTLINSNYSLYESIENMMCIGMVADSILCFLDKPSKFIFDSFSKMLEGLNNKFDIFTLCAINLAKVIQESGYGIETSCCVNCGSKKDIVALDYIQGGFLCIKCLNNSKKRSTLYLKTIRYLFLVGIDDYFKTQLDKETLILIIKEFVIFLQDSFGYKKLSFFELFNTTY